MTAQTLLWQLESLPQERLDQIDIIIGGKPVSRVDLIEQDGVEMPGELFAGVHQVVLR